MLLELIFFVIDRGHELGCLRITLESICCALVAIRSCRFVEAWRQLLLSHYLLKLLAQSLALRAVGFTFNKQLIDLSHLNRSLDLINLQIALVQLTTLLPDCALITVNQLLGISMLLLIGQRCLVAILRVNSVRAFLSWAHACEHCIVSKLWLLDWMEHLLLLCAGGAHRLCLRESSSIHVFEKFVLLCELVLKHL